MQDVRQNRKYRRGTREEIQRKVMDDFKKAPQTVPYCLYLDSRVPGLFKLCHLFWERAVRHCLPDLCWPLCRPREFDSEEPSHSPRQHCQTGWLRLCEA
jgi:hypothetical protein